jgi:hypothetical protein
MGKPLASSETATWLNEHFQSSLGDVKQAVDKYFVGGVNHVFWHGTNYSPEKKHGRDGCFMQPCILRLRIHSGKILAHSIIMWRVARVFTKGKAG